MRLERAWSRESAMTPERATPYESPSARERAITLESPRGSERATPAKSTRSSERAKSVECTRCRERALLDERTMLCERATLHESPYDEREPGGPSAPKGMSAPEASSSRAPTPRLRPRASVVDRPAGGPCWFGRSLCPAPASSCLGTPAVVSLLLTDGGCPHGAACTASGHPAPCRSHHGDPRSVRCTPRLAVHMNLSGVGPP